MMSYQPRDDNVTPTFRQKYPGYLQPHNSYAHRAGSGLVSTGFSLFLAAMGLFFLVALGCAIAIVFFTVRLHGNRDTGTSPQQNKDDVNTIYALSIVILVALVLVAFIRLIGWFMR
nr:hypothetical protein [Sicyoidochytrium minutum DNA virus]